MKWFAWIPIAMVHLAGCTAAPPLQPERIGPDTAAFFHRRDGWLYYENNKDEGRLYRIRPDGSAREKLADLPGVSLLGFDGPATYFGVFRNDDTPDYDWTIDELHRIPADGAPAEKIAAVSILRSATGFIAAGNAVFFNGGDPQQPASLKLDLATGQIETLSAVPVSHAARGSNGSIFLGREGEAGGIERWDPGATAPVTVLSEPVEDFVVDGDGLYYASLRDLATDTKKTLGRLYRVPAAGGSPVRLDAGGSSNIRVSGDWVYHTHGWGPLSRTRTDGSKTERLSSAEVLYPLVAGDWVYYTRGSPLEAFSSTLCRVRTDGSRSQTLLKARAFFVDAGPGWACYRTVDDNQLLRISVPE
jgi:hypothetical protein